MASKFSNILSEGLAGALGGGSGSGTGGGVLEQGDQPDNAAALTAAIFGLSRQQELLHKDPASVKIDEDNTRGDAGTGQQSRDTRPAWLKELIDGIAEVMREQKTKADAKEAQGSWSEKISNWFAGRQADDKEQEEDEGESKGESRKEGEAETEGQGGKKKESNDKVTSERVEAPGGGKGGGGKGGGGTGGDAKGAATDAAKSAAKVTRERVQAQKGKSKQGEVAQNKVKSKFKKLGRAVSKVSGALGVAFKIIGKVAAVIGMVSAAVAAIKAFNDAILQTKRNLKEYSGTVAEGFARLEHQSRQLAVMRGKELELGNRALFESSLELESALGPVMNDLERIKTVVAVGLSKFATLILKFAEATKVLDKIADWTESLAQWFGYGDGEGEDKAPQELYQEMVGMIASGDFTGPHTASPDPK